MFRHEGPSRSHRANEILAASLALIAGYVNAVGFTLLGAFTSHVTGNVGRFGDDVARADISAAIFAAVLVATFFAGSIATTLILSVRRRRTAFGYGIVLVVEAVLLVAFAISPFPPRDLSTARLVDAHAAMLCAAMGLQNAMVTRLSGAVVRTTHLTGVITDLGIEIGRWARWIFRGRDKRIDRPVPEQGILLVTIAVGFTGGTVGGAAAALAWDRWATVLPAVAVVAAAIQAFTSETSRQGSIV